MKRNIVHIDEEKCNGCGACAAACHEAAILMVNGKARLIRDDYCDGLGDCLPACPMGAITITEREAVPYDEAAVKARLAARQQGGGCPGMRQRTRSPEQGTVSDAERPSQLRQWPVQIRLMPVRADYYDGADILIAADCTAYAYAAFHERFMRGCVTLMGCPKLDPVDYAEKLTAILAGNSVRSVTVVRMEVPCCGGLERAAQAAVQACGRELPFRVVTLSVDGAIVG